MKKIILASNSPRRRELLEQVGISFTVKGAEIEEHLDEHLKIEDAVIELAYDKARAVAQNHQEAIVIGADTIVYLHGQVLGKPHTQERAKEMLQRLSGQTHQVITGVAILSENHQECFSVSSEVTFYALEEAVIDAYVKTGEPLDKAGAYGIQGKGAILVAKIVGDYYNIVGLPIAEVVRRLKAFD